MPNALKSCPKSNNSPNLNATHNINLVSNSILNLSSHCETGKYKQKRGWGWPIFKKNPLFFLPNVWTSLQNSVSQILVRQEQLQTLVFEFKSFKVSLTFKSKKVRVLLSSIHFSKDFYMEGLSTSTHERSQSWNRCQKQVYA